MSSILVIVHVLVSMALIMIVLLQTGKGSDVGAAFGAGASSTVFGSAGSSGFLSKLTAAAAIIFMLTSLGLSILAGGRTTGSVMKGFKAPANQEAPVSVPLKTDTGQQQPVQLPAQDK